MQGLLQGYQGKARHKFFVFWKLRNSTPSTKSTSPSSAFCWYFCFYLWFNSIKHAIDHTTLEMASTYLERWNSMGQIPQPGTPDGFNRVVWQLQPISDKHLLKTTLEREWKLSTHNFIYLTTTRSLPLFQLFFQDHKCKPNSGSWAHNEKSTSSLPKKNENTYSGTNLAHFVIEQLDFRSAVLQPELTVRIFYNGSTHQISTNWSSFPTA